MNNNADILEFNSRDEYRKWLAKNNRQETGIWILFVKDNKMFTANDALEESICFGWIDGLIKSIDKSKYKKYFSRRKNVNKWSEKNKLIYDKMVKCGLMMKEGMEAYKSDGKKSDTIININEKVKLLRTVFEDHKEILDLFDEKSPARQNQLAGFYCDAKTDTTREKRKNKIIEALKSGYKGMLY